MRLSERGAIRSAIADGGFHLYPAGRLIDIVKSELAGDGLQGDFNSTATVEKLARVQGPGGEAGEIFERDVSLLKERLGKTDPEYDIDSVFERMLKALPQMAKRYYGIESFEPTRPSILEYYFEGYNDMYKDGDWNAFNVNSAEARELSVPVGTYFKRNQVSPGHPELVTMHEANHAMQELVASPSGYHHYIPWFDEGLADALGRMMLFRATEDEKLLSKTKTFRTEIEVTDPRKVTYHYGEETASLMLIRGRLPFAKALMRTRQREPFSIDWNSFATLIKAGIDPHVTILKTYMGNKLDAFRKKFEKDEKAFRGESDLDQMDLRVLGMFLATQAPARLEPAEYKAALWIASEADRKPNRHWIDPDIIPQNLRSKVEGWESDKLIPAEKIAAELWDKAPAISIKIVIKESDVPQQFSEGMKSLAAKYFIIKRKIGEDTVFEPYGGGLPYRLGTGEIRCAY